jgi:hypothetical protein
MAIDRSAPPRPPMSATLGHLLALALAFAVAGAAAERARAADADDRTMLVILDEDGDGAVTQVEFLRNKTSIARLRTPTRIKAWDPTRSASRRRHSMRPT